MKKNLTRIIAIVLALLLALSVVVAAVLVTALAEDSADQYDFKIQLLDSLDAVRVEQTITYTNRTGQDLTSVLFNLYANAYRRQATAPFELETMESAYPDGFVPGGVDFFSIEVDGKPCDWGVQGTSEAFLRVAVDLKPGGQCAFKFGYELLLPRCNSVLGASELGWKLNHFYPMVAPWDAHLKEFSVSSVLPVGENVFTDPADYRAVIDAPDGAQLVCVGQVSREEKGERVLWTIDAPGVRELPIFVGQRYQRQERRIEGGPKIEAYMTDGGGASYALDIAVDACNFFSDELGAYPLDTLTLVQADYALRSAQFSGVILLDSALLAWNERDSLEYEVVFNLAKQWFGEAVGNNPAREPWLSEATASYMALMYYKAAYGQARFLQELNKRVLPALQMTIPVVLVDSETRAFATVNEYEIVTRNRGAAVLYEVSRSVGEQEMMDVFRRYIEQNKGGIASLPDFASALNKVSGRELGNLLLEMLQTIGEYANQQMDWYE